MRGGCLRELVSHLEGHDPFRCTELDDKTSVKRSWFPLRSVRLKSPFGYRMDGGVHNHRVTRNQVDTGYLTRLSNNEQEHNRSL